MCRALKFLSGILRCSLFGMCICDVMEIRHWAYWGLAGHYLNGILSTDLLAKKVKKCRGIQFSFLQILIKSPDVMIDTLSLVVQNSYRKHEHFPFQKTEQGREKDIKDFFFFFF